MSGVPDPKPSARHVASRGEWDRLAAAKTGACRACGSDRMVELHHLVPRGQRGDDVAQNLVPLCRGCHDSVTNHRAGWEEIAAAVRASLTPLERQYMVAKKGKWWLEKHYPAGASLCPRCRKPKHQQQEQEPRKKTEWTLIVPDDAEAGPVVLDELVDGLASDLGYRDQSSRLRRYHAVVRALVFASVNREVFVKEAA